jgi:hypothetical protein
METKPYNLQSPEQIAKDYGGNKQKIAEAMQMGIVDPTAGTLAGMFIDRMRSAQTQEQAPQQTVAQQIFAPPAPPAPPQGDPSMQQQGAPPQGGMQPPAGLGATPEAAQMAEQMPPMQAPPPEMPPQEAPMGMAEGGLTTLPLPDTMFDEPDGGGYAGGGIVAFARGGYNDFHNAIIAKESGGRYGVPNAEGSGAMGIGQLMPDTARALAKRLGRAYRPELLAGDDEEAREYQDALTSAATKEAWSYAKGDPQLAAQYYFAGPDKKGYGPKTQAYGADLMRRLGQEAIPMPREADTSTAQGRGMSFEDSQAAGRNLVSGFPREEMERAREYALEQLDPEVQKQAAKADMWEGLAAMGFRLAGSSTPNILQAIGEAATATLPELKLSKKERKAVKDDAVKTLMALEDVDRKTAIAGVEVGMDIYKTGLTADQAKRAQMFQEKQLATEVSEKALDRQVTMAAAMYRSRNPSDFDTKFAMYQKSYPGFSEVAILKQMKADGLLGSGQQGMALPGMEETGGAGGDTGGMSIVGSRPVQ